MENRVGNGKFLLMDLQEDQKVASGRQSIVLVDLAQGKDGSLYVSDDSKGTIWK